MGRQLPRNMFLKILMALCVIVHTVHPQMQEPTISPCEMESLLRQLTNPDQANEMHAAALRQQLRDLMENTEQYDYQTGPQVDLVDKRSLGSLARNGQRYGPGGKRNVGALARQGLLRAADVDESYGGQKRSLATLAKNGQLPAATSQEPDREDMLGGAGDDADAAPLLGQQWKRNMAAMARAGLIGSAGRMADANEKRNVASLARSNVNPYWSEYDDAAEADKRNVGALARDWTLPTSQSNSRVTVQKRNIGSMKNSPVHGSKTSKVKRAAFAYDEYPTVNVEQQQDTIYQSEPNDYSELAKYINHLYYVPSQFADDFDSDLHLKKRFLGSMMRDGWSSSYQAPPAKRNIGALARMGLLRNDANSYGQLRAHGGRQQQQPRMAAKRHLGSLARTYHSANPRDNPSPAAAAVNAVQPLSSPSGRTRPAASPAAVGPAPSLMLSAMRTQHRPASHDSTAAAYADPSTRPATITESFAAHALRTAPFERQYPQHPFVRNSSPLYNRYADAGADGDDDATDADNDVNANDDTAAFYTADDIERFAPHHRYLHSAGDQQLLVDDYPDGAYRGSDRNEWVQDQCRLRLRQLAAELF